MGMDVYGKEPKNETGEYFRSNVWWWRRLWDFIFDIDKLFSEHFKVERLISEDLYQSGHCNDGAGLDSELDCKNLAKRVAWAIEEKLAEHREKEVNEEIEQAKEENKFITLITNANQADKIISNPRTLDAAKENMIRLNNDLRGSIEISFAI